MKEDVWTTQFLYRTMSVLTVILSLATPAVSIDCYKCTSINGKAEECEDVFDTTVNTIHLIQRQCFYGFFRGTHCIKLKGEREDGTHIMVRDCANANWGSHCGDIRYLHGNKEERIHGCLEACDHDGCNGASLYRPSVFSPILFLSFFLAVAAVFRLNLGIFEKIAA